MAFRSEAEVLAEERVRVAKRLTAQGRAFARWWPAPKAEPSHFRWARVSDLMPVDGDDR